MYNRTSIPQGQVQSFDTSGDLCYRPQTRKYVPDLKLLPGDLILQVTPSLIHDIDNSKALDFTAGLSLWCNPELDTMVSNFVPPVGCRLWTRRNGRVGHPHRVSLT